MGRLQSIEPVVVAPYCMGVFNVLFLQAFVASSVVCQKFPGHAKTGLLIEGSGFPSFYSLVTFYGLCN